MTDMKGEFTPEQMAALEMLEKKRPLSLETKPKPAGKRKIATFKAPAKAKSKGRHRWTARTQFST